MDDCLIIGGGVIGLTLAYELAGQGRRVRIVDRGLPGKAASWTGAGTLPPAPLQPSNPLEHLFHWSNELLVDLSADLQRKTGIDNGYRHCGALHVARDDAAAAELAVVAANATRTGIRFLALSRSELAQLEPALDANLIHAAYHLPDECQLRNPRHLKALVDACGKRGVAIVANAEVLRFQVSNGSVTGVSTMQGDFSAKQYCITTGAWTTAIAEHVHLSLAVKPIRGQIVLMKLPQIILQRIVNQGLRYLVPRDDGRVIVGSTLEDVGFDTSTTADVVTELVRFARELAPPLQQATVEDSWAGLRPASVDGSPYLGRVPHLANCFVAAGHHRNGLQLSTATAVIMARLMAGEEPGIDLTPFRIDR